ncbi:MinD/ParA family protein [Persephonella atlantica]|uniref:MinD/ParA family protein n=1 Tax=Persephonella atlantica TaxID=2699429 RepID=A0ABS1GHI8_9AQUI|nr:MinD/ParA family protein [Persephonella atlantica]MBK3332202.1 MinD/ParA family protein [Persephonella atlantica]
MKDQAQMLRDMAKSIRPFDFQVISITSGKGGVGKTSFTVNLAYHLQKLGKTVLILDADLALANVDIILGERPKYNLLHLLSGEKNINEIIWESKYGIKFIPASSGFEELANLSKEKQIQILNALQEIYYSFDIMLIDTSAGISENVINFCLASDKTLVITTPDPTALADSYAISRIILTNKPEHLEAGLIVNFVNDEQEAEKIHRGMNNILREFTGKTMKYYGSLRKDKKLSDSVKDRYILSAKYPKSPYSLDVEHIARYIVEGKVLKKKENFWNRFLRNLKNLKVE